MKYYFRLIEVHKILTEIYSIINLFFIYDNKIILNYKNTYNPINRSKII